MKSTSQSGSVCSGMSGSIFSGILKYIQIQGLCRQNVVKEMTLSHAEFARRFEQHILPQRYVKICHCGFLSHQDKSQRLQRLHRQMNLPPPMPKVTISTALRVMLKTGVDINICPVCKRGRMIYQHTFFIYNGELSDITTMRNRGSPNVKSSK